MSDVWTAEQEGPQGDGARASTLENGRTSQNGAASSELDTEQKGLLRSVTVSTALPKEKVKKKAKSSKKVLGKKSKKSTSLGSDNGFGGSLVEVSSQKKGKKALDKAGDGAEMESGGSKETMSRKAADKPAKETKSAAPKLTRSKAFNGRAPEGKVAANENVPEGEVAVNGRVLVAEISDNGRSPEGGIAVNGRAPEGEVAANGKVPEREIAVTGRVLDAEISDNARLPELEISANGRLPEGEIPVNGRSSEREVAVIGTTPEGETAVNGRVPKGEVADIGRVPEGDLVVATALAEGDTASQNGAQALGAETDAATESFLDRLASSLQAGPSNSEGPVNSGALLLRSVSGCAFVVTEAAAKRVEDLANEGESAGVGAGLFEAASSLVENIVDSAQAGGEVTGQVRKTSSSLHCPVSGYLRSSRLQNKCPLCLFFRPLFPKSVLCSGWTLLAQSQSECSVWVLAAPANHCLLLW